MIVEWRELLMMPEAACIAARHTDDMGPLHHLGDEMSSNAVGLHVKEMHNIEGPFAMGAGGERYQLRDNGLAIGI